MALSTLYLPNADFSNSRPKRTLSLISAFSPQDFNRVIPLAAKDKQVTGEGVLIQHMLYLFSQSVEGFTHIGNAGNKPDTGTLWGEIIFPSLSVHGSTP